MSRGAHWTQEIEEYLAALGRGDRPAAVGQVRRLRDDGHDVVTLVSELLAPAQLRVGELWVADTWSVAREHAATAISESVLTMLALERETTAAVPADAPAVIVSCVEQEWHALPALMVAEHLRADGYAVTFLGANSSAQVLVRHVHDLGPVAALLSCSLSGFLPLARRQVEAVRETGTPVVVGGAAFDADGRRARTLGATAFARSAAGVGDLVGSLPAAVPPVPPLTHPGAEEAFVVFGDREQLADDVHQRLLRSLPCDTTEPPRRAGPVAAGARGPAPARGRQRGRRAGRRRPAGAGGHPGLDRGRAQAPSRPREHVRAAHDRTRRGTGRASRREPSAGRGRLAPPGPASPTAVPGCGPWLQVGPVVAAGCMPAALITAGMGHFPARPAPKWPLAARPQP